MDNKSSTQGAFTGISKSESTSGSVDCLGTTFPNDEERRKFFAGKLKEKLNDPDFRKIEGFPIGSDADIMALSDPPYYTACPNPFIEEFVKTYGKPYDEKNDSYSREPFAADISEGKHDPIYNAHSYHTKVPHQAIMRYILHYTEPGDIVFDAFCGTGMTGVAAQLCGDKSVVESLGYRVLTNNSIVDSVGERISGFGARQAALNDISTVATFISNKTNNTYYLAEDINNIHGILQELEERDNRYRTTNHNGWPAKLNQYDRQSNSPISKGKGVIDYIIWSDIIACPHCGNIWTYWDSPAVNKSSKEPYSVFKCDACNMEISKGHFEITRSGWFDPLTGQAISLQRKIPVLINYSVGSKRFEKFPDSNDLSTIGELDKNLQEYLPFGVPLPPGFNTNQPMVSHGWTYTHHFFSSRTLYFLSRLISLSSKNSTILFMISAALQKLTLRNRFMPWYGGRALVGPHPGTLYVPNLSVENDVLSQVEFHLKKIKQLLCLKNQVYITTQSSSELCQVPDNSLDYIFIDPPFGSNIMYSELNIFWESMLKVVTNNALEAIENPGQGKDVNHYGKQMKACFVELYRTLKPGRWMTVEFHNSRNAIWNIIGETLTSAGFIIADVRILDKAKSTIHQIANSNSVDKDLIISCYKPSGTMEGKFKLEAGTEAGAWDFVRGHLRQLPVFVGKNSQAETVAERQSYMLYDRMVAFHVQHGVLVPLSAAEFYAGLAQKFPERDGMFFLPEQATQYEKKRLNVKEFQQLALIVKDESSAIQWLRQILYEKPQTFQELHPQFMREIGGWQKFEKPLELKEMLEENFICYDGIGDVTSQIHSYLSSNFHELRGLTKDNSILKTKAKDRWYVADPNKSIDLEKLRERSLLREFQDYVQSTQKRLKVFRLEAVRAGFKRAWAEADYRTIVNVAEKLPAIVLEEDQMLLMWYSNAQTRLGAKLT